MDIVRNLGKIEEPNTQRNKRENRLWTPPGLGCIKVNVNGSFLANLGRGNRGTLFVIRRVKFSCNLQSR